MGPGVLGGWRGPAGKERERTFAKFTGNRLQLRSQMFTNPRILILGATKTEGQLPV